MGALNGIDDEMADQIGTSKARLNLLNTLNREGKPEGKIKACLKALEVLPDDITVRKLLAEIYLEQGSIKLAKIELERISKQIDELSSIYKLQAELYREEDRIEEAINSLKLYLSHHSDDQGAAQLLSKLSGSSDEEISILPTSTLAEIYYKQGELKEAIKIYKQVVKNFPDDEKSKNRLDELTAIMETEEPVKSHEDIEKEKKLSLIGILQRWLTDIEKRKIINLSSQT